LWRLCKALPPFVDEEIDCFEVDDLTRFDLAVVEGDEGAGEPVDPDPVVPTVSAN
jgi:hypothetical protein